METLDNCLIGVLPGPQVSSATRWVSFLGLLVDEAVQSGLDSKLIPTLALLDGKIMKAPLNMVVADTPPSVE